MNNNNYNFTSVYISPSEGDIQKDNCGGEHIKNYLKEYWIFLAVKHRKKQTRITYYYPVKIFLEFLDKNPKDITKNDVDNWIIYQNDNGYKPNGIVTRIIAVDKYLKWLGKPELIIKKPPWAKTYRRTISFDDIQQMLKTARKMSSRHELILRFITDLDCRGNEICNAKWSNIVDDKFYFDDTKTGDNYGFLTPMMCEVLEVWKQDSPTPKKGFEDYILLGTKTNNKGKKYSPRAKIIYKLVQEIADKSNLGKKVKPYDLRASVITEEFNHYINPKTIQRKARHKNQLTTQRYNRIDDEMVREYVNYNLIFDKPSLCVNKSKNNLINLNLCDSSSPQDINNMENEDNTRFSFSFSLFNQTSFMEQMGLGLLPPSNKLSPIFIERLFPKPASLSKVIL